MLGVSGCRSVAAGRRGPALEQRVGPQLWSRLALVHESLRASDLEAARAELQSVCRRAPDEPEPALLLQEVELRLLEQGVALASQPSAPSAAATIDGARLADAPPASSTAPETAAVAPSPLDALQRYAAREDAAAEQDGGFVACLRAARVASDPSRAEHWLARAELARPDSAWVPYARAHAGWTLGQDQRGAQAQLSRALEIDAGLLPALRLRAALEAREGRAEDALDALEAWLEPARLDPCVWPSELRAAELDRGALLILTGEPKDARRELERQVDLSADERARRDLLLAAAHEARNEPIAALQAAQAAALVPGAELLALQQQALLYELWLQDLNAARGVWERVLGAASAADATGSLQPAPLEKRASAPSADPNGADASGVALQALLLRVQARAHIERIDRELARRRDQART